MTKRAVTFCRNSPLNILLLLAVCVELCLDLDRQTEQVDKACGICLVVIFILTEGRGLLIVQGIGRGNTGVDEVALVELQLDFTGDGFLCLVLGSIGCFSGDIVAYVIFKPSGYSSPHGWSCP